MKNKKDFDALYNLPDPCELLNELCELKYVLNTNITPFFDDVLRGLASSSTSVHVLDLCCSYGFNASVIKYGDAICGWRDRLQRTASDQRCEEDRSFVLSARDRHPNVIFSGVDKAKNAVDYAVNCGLLYGGWCGDLEIADDLDFVGKSQGGDVDIVLCTGAIGYITSATFNRVIKRHSRSIILFSVMDGIDPSDLMRQLGSMQYSTRNVGRVIQRRRATEENGGCVREEQSNVIFASVFVSNPRGLTHTDI